MVCTLAVNKRTNILSNSYFSCTFTIWMEKKKSDSTWTQSTQFLHEWYSNGYYRNVGIMNPRCCLWTENYGSRYEFELKSRLEKLCQRENYKIDAPENLSTFNNWNCKWINCMDWFSYEILWTIRIHHQTAIKLSFPQKPVSKWTTAQNQWIWKLCLFIHSDFIGYST